MGCCLSFSQGSKSWIALLFPIFASFSSGQGIVSIPITLSLLLVLFAALLSFKISKKGKILMDKEEAPEPSLQENSLPEENFHKKDDVIEILEKREEEEVNGEGFLVKSQDLYSENESMDHFSSSSSEGHCSDIDWPYNMKQRIELDCSDDSISDEESLIEIAIPSGEFVSQEVKDDPKFNLKCCKDFSIDFLADMNEINEEDNLIEIDIYMGSIKCSSFEI